MKKGGFENGYQPERGTRIKYGMTGKPFIFKEMRRARDGDSFDLIVTDPDDPNNMEINKHSPKGWKTTWTGMVQGNKKTTFGGGMLDSKEKKFIDKINEAIVLLNNQSVPFKNTSATQGQQSPFLLKMIEINSPPI